jgi:hypothetical protein
MLHGVPTDGQCKESTNTKLPVSTTSDIATPIHMEHAPVQGITRSSVPFHARSLTEPGPELEPQSKPEKLDASNTVRIRSVERTGFIPPHKRKRNEARALKEASAAILKAINPPPEHDADVPRRTTALEAASSAGAVESITAAALKSLPPPLAQAPHLPQDITIPETAFTVGTLEDTSAAEPKSYPTPPTQTSAQSREANTIEAAPPVSKLKDTSLAALKPLNSSAHHAADPCCDTTLVEATSSNLLPWNTSSAAVTFLNPSLEPATRHRRETTGLEAASIESTADGLAQAEKQCKSCNRSFNPFQQPQQALCRYCASVDLDRIAEANQTIAGGPTPPKSKPSFMSSYQHPDLEGLDFTAEPSIPKRHAEAPSMHEQIEASHDNECNSSSPPQVASEQSLVERKENRQPPIPSTSQPE